MAYGGRTGAAGPRDGQRVRAGGRARMQRKKVSREKRVQAPFMGRPRFLTVVFNPNCLTALTSHPSDPYGLLLIMTWRIFSTSSVKKRCLTPFPCPDTFPLTDRRQAQLLALPDHLLYNGSVYSGLYGRMI